MAVTVTIIIRTCNRPHLLREALRSVQQQTFCDFEVVVVEDGPGTSKHVIDEFPDLNITYHSSGNKVGRCRAANIGLELSEGQYINFLDDDDLFLPNHVQTMIKGFSVYPEAVAIHTSSLERKVTYVSLDPLKINVAEECEKYNEPLNEGEILFQNKFPIQAVMFKRELYEKYGGLDEKLEYLEDWDLWIKYSLQGKFCYIDEVTSVYHVPADRQRLNERHKQLKDYEKVIHEKYRKYREASNYRSPTRFTKLKTYLNKYGIRKTVKKLVEKMIYR